MHTTHSLFTTNTVLFDSQTPENNSLYLSAAPELNSTLRNAVNKLIAEGLWNSDGEKAVRDDQRQAYIDKLEIAETVELAGSKGIVLIKGHHPKYPADDAQWQRWLACLNRN